MKILSFTASGNTFVSTGSFPVNHSLNANPVQASVFMKGWFNKTLNYCNYDKGFFILYHPLPDFLISFMQKLSVKVQIPCLTYINYDYLTYPNVLFDYFTYPNVLSEYLTYPYAFPVQIFFGGKCLTCPNSFSVMTGEKAKRFMVRR